VAELGAIEAWHFEIEHREVRRVSLGDAQGRLPTAASRTSKPDR